MCHFNLCQNNAVCQRFQTGGYKCICHAGFTGECCWVFENINIGTPNLIIVNFLQLKWMWYLWPLVLNPLLLLLLLYCVLDLGKLLVLSTCISSGYVPVIKHGNYKLEWLGYLNSLLLSPPTPPYASSLLIYVYNAFKLIDCCFIFLGIHCETDINECNQTALPCHNGGTCVDGIDGYTCQCSPGFSGPYCNVTVTKCDGSPCQNGATCVENILR